MEMYVIRANTVLGVEVHKLDVKIIKEGLYAARCVDNSYFNRVLTEDCINKFEDSKMVYCDNLAKGIEVFKQGLLGLIEKEKERHQKELDGLVHILGEVSRGIE